MRLSSVVARGLTTACLVAILSILTTAAAGMTALEVTPGRPPDGPADTAPPTIIPRQPLPTPIDLRQESRSGRPDNRRSDKPRDQFIESVPTNTPDPAHQWFAWCDNIRLGGRWLSHECVVELVDEATNEVYYCVGVESPPLRFWPSDMPPPYIPICAERGNNVAFAKPWGSTLTPTPTRTAVVTPSGGPTPVTPTPTFLPGGTPTPQPPTPTPTATRTTQPTVVLGGGDTLTPTAAPPTATPGLGHAATPTPTPRRQVSSDSNTVAPTAASTASPTPIVPCIANITVIVFHDLDGNGRLDQGEPRLPDWVVDVRGPGGSRLVTGPDGTARLANLTNGADYTLALTLPHGWLNTTPNPRAWTGECGEALFGVNLLLLPTTGRAATAPSPGRDLHPLTSIPVTTAAGRSLLTRHLSSTVCSPASTP